MSDREIIQLHKNGRGEEAFRELVRAYSERLYWRLRHFLLSHEDADDLLQDIFIKVWQALPSFRGESGLYTWLYRIATNEALNFIKKAKSKGAESLETLKDEGFEPAQSSASPSGDEIQRRLAAAVRSLPPRQRIVFTMRYLDELPYEEISGLLGTSVGALKASYHFAVEKIKEKVLH